MKKGLYILALSINIVGAQQYNDLADISQNLVAKEYEKANSKIAKLNAPQSKKVLTTLTNILMHNGQKKKLDSIYIYSATEEYENHDLNLAKRIAQAYYYLYYSKDAETIIPVIDATYLLSKRSEIRNLRKLTVICFLILYSRENTLSLQSFNYYLEQFEDLAETINDKALLLYYTNYFDGMSASFPARYDRSSNELYEFTVKYEKEISLPIRNHLYQNIAMNFRANGMVDSTRVYLEKIISKPNAAFDTKLRFRTFLELGRISALDNNKAKAIGYFKKAKSNFNKNDTLYSSVLYDRFLAFHYYDVLKEYDSAYFLLKKSRLNEAKLNYKQNNLKVSELNTRLRTAEKEKQFQEEEQRATFNQNLFLSTLAALILGALIAVLFQKNTTKKRLLAEQQEQIQKQKVQTLLKEQELASIDAMIVGQEKERSKVANELHDDLGSLMATIRLHFDNIGVTQKNSALQNAKSLLDEAYQKIRSMAHSKNSGVMANQGLLPAVEKMARTISQTNTLDISVEDFGLGERMENSLELTLFRIIQELVANIIRHSEATKATIQFTQHKESMNIIVEDNGKGFDMSAIERETGGMGLGTIEKRIEHLAGSFTVDSVLGRGTSILIDIPI